MTELKQLVPTAVNSVGLLGLLAFNLKKFKDLETKLEELEEKVNKPQKPVKVDNTEIIEKLNKKIEQMIPKTIEKHVIKPSENPPNIVIEEYDDDVDIAINELLT